jgi:hypothetical protein
MSKFIEKYNMIMESLGPAVLDEYWNPKMLGSVAIEIVDTAYKMVKALKAQENYDSTPQKSAEFLYSEYAADPAKCRYEYLDAKKLQKYPVTEEELISDERTQLIKHIESKLLAKSYSKFH